MNEKEEPGEGEGHEEAAGGDFDGPSPLGRGSRDLSEDSFSPGGMTEQNIFRRLEKFKRILFT